jgi:hypothetical protein
MRRLCWVLGVAVLAGCETASPGAPPAEPPPPPPQVAGCEAGPEWELPAGQDLRVRFARVTLLPESSGNGLALEACIDTVHPAVIASAKMAVFRRDGRLAGSAGQQTAPRASGRTYTVSMASETLKPIAAMGPFARDVVLQVALLPTAGGAPVTETVRTRAQFTGVQAAPAAPKPGTCLAAPPADGSAQARDLWLSLDDKGTARLFGCVVARRMAYAELIGRVLVGAPAQSSPVVQGPGLGNGIGSLAPVRGDSGRTLALLAAEAPVAGGPAYPLVPVDLKVRSCREPAGAACTPGTERVEVLAQWLAPL